MTARILALALAVLEPSAHAAPDADEARRLFEEGVDLADRTQWAEALDRFERSRAIVERPSTVYNLGNAYLHVGRPVEAAREIERYLALIGEQDPIRRAEAARLLQSATSSIAELVLTISSTSARVTVDGTADTSGGARRVLRLNPGEHVIEVSAPDAMSLSMTIPVAMGARLERHIELTSPEVSRAPPVEREEPSILESPWLWAAIGVVVVGAAIGIGVAAGSGEREPYGGTLDVVIGR